MNTSTVMTRDIVVVSRTVTVGVAARMMQKLRIRHLPVVEEGRLVGILSDRDLLKQPSDSLCGEAMTAAPVTCLSNASVSQVAQLMLQHKIDSIPIVSYSGALTGLVTSTDLIALLVEQDQAQLLPFDFRLRTAASDSDALFD
jgi:acetoin utilization protein AcuB